jgi:hypothetical protein
MEETGFRIVEVAITGQAKERSGKISESDAGEEHAAVESKF